MDAVIYTRISSDKSGEGLGVERQRTECLALAERLGWTVVDTFSDNDISAYSGKVRPGYRAMLAAVEAGQVGGILAWHSDRLHRSMTELESFIDSCKAHAVQIQTVTSGDLNLSTASGKMLARMLSAAARGEVEHSIERMKAGHRQAAEAGKWRARRRVFGYELGGVAVVKEEAAAIKDGAERFLSGVSLREVARNWNAAGLKPTGSSERFDASSVRRILASPRYAALQEYRGVIVAEDCDWPKVLDVDTHRAIKAIISDPARANNVGRERRWQGSGVYLCGLCGSKMTMWTGSNPAAKHNYRCVATHHLSRQALALDGMVSGLVVRILSRPEAATLFAPTDDANPADVQRDRDGLQARLEQLAGLFADGSIDASQLKRGTAELRPRLEALDGQLARLRQSDPIADLALSGNEIEARWEGFSPDVRGKIIDRLMTVTVLKSPRGQRRFNPDYVDIQPKM